jgi:hypothetical protein
LVIRAYRPHAVNRRKHSLQAGSAHSVGGFIMMKVACMGFLKQTPMERSLQ